MLIDPVEKKLAQSVTRFVHAENFSDAAKLINECCELELKSDFMNPAKSVPVIQHYLHYLMNNGGMEEAAQLLWTPTQFTPEPQSVQAIWKLFDESGTGLIMGAASLGKSYGMGVRLFLEWIRDPNWTSIKLIGPNEDHLEQNLFSHIVSLHQSAKLPMPGEIGELFVGLDRRNQLSAIKGIIIPIGKVKKAGRLQGAKRKPRPEPHPIFGSLSRMFVFIDEAENVPGGLWSDIDNVLSNAGEGGLKIFMAYNPTNQHDEVAKRAEPEFGWENFDSEKHFKWRSKRGWDVLRLDGERSENVIRGEVIYPGLQTREGLEKIARNAGGRTSAGYFSMGRGAYPPQGVELTIVPSGLFYKMRGEFIWYNSPEPVGACDVALEGGDAAVYSLGKCGLASGKKLSPSIDFPTGQTVMFKDKKGNVLPRWAVQLDQQFTLPKAATPEMKDKILLTSKRAGVRPEYFALDRTGVGTGVADFIKHEWSSAVHDLNYSDGPPKDKKIMLEDTKTCDEEYDRMCSVLWFMTRMYGEFDYFLISPSVDITNLAQQLTQRRYRPGKSKRVESKRDYMSRGFSSPNEADSLTLLVYAARFGSGVTPSMKGDSVPLGHDGFDDDYWSDRYPGGVYIDVTNKTEILDEREGLSNLLL